MKVHYIGPRRVQYQTGRVQEYAGGSPLCRAGGLANAPARYLTTVPESVTCGRCRDLLRSERSRPCAVPGCSKPSMCKGLCQPHYRRQWKGRPDWDGPLRFYRNPLGPDEGKYQIRCRMKRATMERIRRTAKSRGLSPWQLVGAILDAWHEPRPAAEDRIDHRAAAWHQQMSAVEQL